MFYRRTHLRARNEPRFRASGLEKLPGCFQLHHTCVSGFQDKGSACSTHLYSPMNAGLIVRHDSSRPRTEHFSLERAVSWPLDHGVKSLIHFSRFLSSPCGCLFRKVSGECRARTCDLLINSQTLPPTELKPHKKYRLMDFSARRLFVFYMQMSYYTPVGFPRHNRPAIKISGFFS